MCETLRVTTLYYPRYRDKKDIKMYTGFIKRVNRCFLADQLVDDNAR